MCAAVVAAAPEKNKVTIGKISKLFVVCAVVLGVEHDGGNGDTLQKRNKNNEKTSACRKCVAG